MKKFLIIVLLLFGIGFSNDYLAQTGGRKREHRNHKRVKMRRGKSAGHADEFARGGGRKSAFSRLFKKQRPAFTPRNNKTDNSRYSDNHRLFKRYRTKGKEYNANLQSKKNADRARRRVRGNKTFSRKKY